MNANRQTPLNLFIIIAGTVLALQLILALSSARPIGFRELGILSKEIVLAIMLMVIALSISLVLLSFLSLLPGLMPELDLSRFHLLPLVAGAELAVLGLAAINLSRSVEGTAAPIMPFGIELFSVGMISVAFFVESMGPSFMVRNLPNHSFLMFFLSLLPASLLITI